MKPTLSQQVKSALNSAGWPTVMISTDKCVRDSISPNLDAKAWRKLRVPVLRNTHKSLICMAIINNQT